MLRALGPEALHLGRAAAAGGRRQALPRAGCARTPRAATRAAISHHYDVSQPLLRVGPRARRWPTPARSTRRATPRSRRRSTRSSTSSAASSALQPGHAAARRRLRLGRHGRCTPREHYGVEALGVTLSRAAGRVGAEARSPSAGSTDLAEVRHLRLPRRDRDRLRRGQLDRPHRAHRHRAARRRTSRFLSRQAARRRGRLLNHCITRPDDHSAPIRRRRLHRPLRLPRRRAAGRRARLVSAMQRRRLRGAPRGEPARALRA